MKLDLSGNRRNDQIPDSYLLVPRAWSALASSMVFSFGPPSRPREVFYLFVASHTMCIGDFEMPVVDFNTRFATHQGERLPRLGWCRRSARDGLATLTHAGIPFGWSYAAAAMQPEETYV